MPEFEYPDSYRNLNSIKSNSWEGPYTSVANANASIPLGVREQGVLVTIIEGGVSKKYWYKDGLNDINLVEFITDITGKADTIYVDAQDAKKENKIPTVFGSFSGGLTATATTGLSLMTIPTLILINFANQNTVVGNPTLNVDGLGAKEIWDSRTNAIHTQTSIPNGKRIVLYYADNRFYTLGLEPLYGKSYIDAQDLKSVNAEGLFIVVNTSDSGATFAGTSSRTLSSMPRFFSLSIISANLYTNSSTININGFGAKLLKDANGDNILISGAGIEFRWYNCYYDNLTDTIRVLNFTNVNGVQIGTLSTNNYIISKNFPRFPNEINIRVDATNPTTTPQLSLIVAGASPVLYNIVDQYGIVLIISTLIPGRLYSFRFNNITNQYEVQGIF